MGMYTRFVINVAIKDDTPSVALVQAMIDCDKTHPVFPEAGEGRHPYMLHQSSYYHDAIQHAAFVHDAIACTWKLSAVCDLKNYDDEIVWFLNTIAPDVDTDECAGYFLYEEHIAPTLFWFADRKLVTFTPDLSTGSDALRGLL